jgi:hypothetical protein
LRRAAPAELRAPGATPETTALTGSTFTRTALAARTIAKTARPTSAEATLATLVATPRATGAARAARTGITPALSGRTPETATITAIKAAATFATRTILR